MEYIENPKLKEMKQGNKVWEEWNDFKIIKRHYCINQKFKEELESADNAVFLARDNYNRIKWHFAHVWLADKEEVSDGEAEEIGEIINYYCTIVNFCPYCGKELIKEEAVV